MAKAFRSTASIILACILLPIIGEFFIKQAEKWGLYDKPGELLGTIFTFVVSVAELPYFRLIAAALTAFVLGLWVDWLMRRFDSDRVDALKALGWEFDDLADRVERSQGGFRSEWPNNIGHMVQDLISAFVKARKLGLAAPKEQILQKPNSGPLLRYLRLVGKFLTEGQFDEAFDAARKMNS
jgi:hypothetical protein